LRKKLGRNKRGEDRALGKRKAKTGPGGMLRQRIRRAGNENIETRFISKKGAKEKRLNAFFSVPKEKLSVGRTAG